jgi:hypothetical protein
MKGAAWSGKEKDRPESVEERDFFGGVALVGEGVAAASVLVLVLKEASALPSVASALPSVASALSLAASDAAGASDVASLADDAASSLSASALSALFGFCVTNGWLSLRSRYISFGFTENMSPGSSKTPGFVIYAGRSATAEAV